MVQGLLRLLGIGLDQSGIGSNVLVGFLDLGICFLVKSGKCTLLVEDCMVQALRSFGLVLGHDLASLLRAGQCLLLALVLESSSGSKLGMHFAHLAVEVILGDLGILCHLGEKHL